MHTENNKELIGLDINELVSYYSNKEGINGILMEINNDSDERTEIRIIITYTDLKVVNKDLCLVRKLEEISKKSNVKVLINFIPSIEFGLLGIHLLEKGQPNCCSTLIDGYILFDRTGKYQELQDIAKRTSSSRGLRRVRTPHVNRVVSC